jgi:hypothetical protein
MPCDYKNYPKDWKEIRASIMKRAQNRCECMGECGLHHDRRCCEWHGHKAMWAKGKIVLTIAHLDHDTTHNESDNLRAFCQRCHNRYDQPHRQSNARKTRERKNPQMRLF